MEHACKNWEICSKIDSYFYYILIHKNQILDFIYASENELECEKVVEQEQNPEKYLKSY